MLRVALTGNVASGKSTVAEVWARAGVPVVSADDLARDAVLPGSDGLARVVEAFGADVLAADGTLDRDRMRARVFDDAGARERLEVILHPRIAELRDGWSRARRAEGVRLTVAEIPLLFEVGGEADFDRVVLVDAAPETRRARLAERPAVDAEQARAIMSAQMDPALKRGRADVVLDNDGTLEELERAALDVLEQLREDAGVPLVCLDLHLHTAGSFDCLSDPERVLERLDARGFARFAITDHDRLEVGLRMAEAHPGRVIAGEEVKTAEGIDVIGLYLSEEIPGGTPAEETVRRIREQGGLAYLPHPYARGKGGGGRWAERLAPLVDVVEAFNGRLHDPRLNERAADLAVRHGRPAGAGSDAHTLGELGRVGVTVRAHPSTPRALAAALVHGRIEGTSSSRLVHLASTWAKVRKRFGSDGAGR